MRGRYRHLRLLVLCGCIFCLNGRTEAQKGAPPGPAGAPSLNVLMPLGVQRGTTLELNITGANLADPVTLWTSIPGAKATIPTDNNNGKDPAKLKVVLEVPKDAPLGFHMVRLATARGLSNLRLFCVDDLPQVVSTGGNRAKATAQPLQVPSVVAGTVAAEASDYYKITVAAGQRLSFEVLGRRLGSAFDPQVSVIDPRNQREIAHSNDAPGLQTDPRLTHTFKDAGEYLVEVRDVMYRGAGDFAYRLRVGDFPCATTPIPMAAKRGSKVNVTFAGTFVEGVAPVEVQVPTDPSVDVLYVTPKGPSGLPGWPVPLVVSDIDEVVEQEPNNDPAKATPVPVPGAVTARFETKGDIDHFSLPLKKGRYIIEAHTLEFNSPTEVYMVLRGDKGAEVAKTNPTAAPRLDFSAPADGNYTLAVEHLHYWGGPAESYRVSVTPYEPGFDLVVGADRIDVPQGQAAVLNIIGVNRRDFPGPIEVSVVGPPGVTGQATITAGVVTKAPPQPNQPAPAVARLIVQAGPDAPMGAYPIKVQGKATINGKPVVVFATARPAVTQALAGLPFPPRQVYSQIAAAITEKPPFNLLVKLDHPEAAKEIPANVTITAVRGDGFAEEIVLTPLDLPPNVVPAAKVLKIEKGQNEFKTQLALPKNAPVGEFAISFTGKAKSQNKDYVVTALPVSLNIGLPFNLKVEPAPLKIDAGEKAKIKVVAERKAGYEGPITLEFRGLPTGVTAAKVNIDQGKNDAEVELTAAANSQAGDKVDVNVLGTATGAGNQQNATANFTVTVQKK